jgi:hypothetical protein
MHKLESFALSCGSKINKPYIEKSFYPIIDKKFICISQESESSSKSYEYFNDVIFHIKPFLDENNIAILEIGSPKNIPLYYTKHYSKLNPMQANYLISKSMLYFGNLNFYANLASNLGKNIVCPVNNDYHNLTKPYWSNENNCNLINAICNKKPMFSEHESPKTIHEVFPEVISRSILDNLNIKHNLDKIETVFIGDEYNSTSLDVVPGLYELSKINVQGVVNLRMDRNFDLNFLTQAHLLDGINLVSDKIIPTQYLNHISSKLHHITFFIDNNTSLQDLEHMQSSGKPITLFSKDKKNISKIRLKFIDFNVELYQDKNDIDFNVGEESKLKFLSRRNIVSKGQAFNSYVSEAYNSNTSLINKIEDFREDLPFIRIFKETS